MKSNFPIDARLTIWPQSKVVIVYNGPLDAKKGRERKGKKENVTSSHKAAPAAAAAAVRRICE
jgi:hypothetical protein